MARLLTADDLYTLNLASDTQISPDGTRVAFVRTAIDRDAYEYRHTIWLVPTSGEPRQFTSGPNDRAPRWSPDGRTLAFLRAPAGDVKPASEDARDRGVSKPQIWLLPVDGGEARQLTALRDGAGTPVWSPDGATILFAAETGEPDDPEAEDAPLHDKRVPRVRHIERVWHRTDGHGFSYETQSHIFSIPATGGEATQHTSGDWNDGAPSWSPDGTRVAFVSDRTDERWSTPAAQVWVLDIATGEQMRVTSEERNCTSPSWSPDSKMLAYLADPRRNGTGHQDLWVAPAHPEDGEERCLTGDFTPTCSATCIDDMRAGHGVLPVYWSRDGHEIYFLASMRGTVHIYAARPGSDLLPTRVTDGDRHVYTFSLDTANRTLALGMADAVTPGDVYIQAVPREGEPEHLLMVPRRMTNLNEKLLAEIDLATPEELTFRGADGWEIQGWLMRPPHARSDEQVPGVLEIHGGPAAMYGYSFFFEFQLLAAAGYAVIYVNPRGSTGYGRVFSGAVVHDWGGKDYQDIMAGLNAALARGGIDANQLGVAGGSYGGYMTAWVVSHTNRFKAAVTMRLLSNWASFFGTSDIGPSFALDHIGATPWENLDLLMEHSPYNYVANIHTPLLILHSDSDFRCPLSEAEQLFTALKWLGRDTELVIFEGQSHDLSRNGHPRSRVIRLNEITRWFEQYIPIA